MKIRSALAPGSITIGKRIGDISPDANKRLKWFDYYYSHGSNARLACRHFDISPQTFYRWLNRYDPKDLKTLESRSHRPKHVRQPTYSTELVNAVLRLREAYPRWGKDKPGGSTASREYPGFGFDGRQDTEVSENQGSFT